MALCTLTPVAIQQFFDNNGDPLAGGKLSFYEAGTSTPTPAYADFNLTTPLSNPIILDAGGRPPELFLAALTYKQGLQDANNVTLWTADNIVTPGSLRSVGSSTTSTGTQHDVPVPQRVIAFLDFRSTVDVTIDGFAGGTAGQLLFIRALNPGLVHLVNNTASTAATGNQLVNFV